MWNMISSFEFETLLSMSGSDIPESVLKALNKQLNAFDLID